MKLVRFRMAHKKDYGFIERGNVISLQTLARLLNKELPDKLEDFIISGEESVKMTARMVDKAEKSDIKKASIPFQEASLLAPIAFPPKIVCLGLNYRDHAKEQNASLPDEPIIFMKPHTTIIGPDENIVKPKFVKQLDYEAELVIVIGKKGKNIPVSKADSHVFGYTIMNDVSARDIQFKDKQWTRGKSFDTFAPMGPCIVTKDQLNETVNLHINTWVNGEHRQNSNTSNMVFKTGEIISHLSHVMTLEPCDVIATGTPSGVGFAWKPQPKFLNVGDTVKIEVERIGVLQNTVTDDGK